MLLVYRTRCSSCQCTNICSICSELSCDLQLKAAKRHVASLAKQTGQQRFTLADLDSILASLPDSIKQVEPEGNAGSPAHQGQGTQEPNSPSDKSGAEGIRGVEIQPLADVSCVPVESRGGARQKRSRQLANACKGEHRAASTGTMHY